MDGLLVEPRLGTVRGVDDQVDALAFDQVDHVGAAFLHFIDTFDVEPGLFEDVRGTRGGYQLESHVDEATGNVGDLRLVVVGDADEDRTLRRQFLSSGDLRLGEGFAEVVGDAHDFASGAHFWAEDGIDAGQLTPREYRRLHVKATAGIEIGAAFDVFWKEFAQLAACHEAGRDLGHGHAGGFRNVGHCAGSARIDFKDVNRAALGAIAFRSV